MTFRGCCLAGNDPVGADLGLLLEDWYANIDCGG
jgi:hypothetical protein